MAKGSLKIHSENILPIIKQWLYSDKDIFLRELISNACDAMSKLKMLRDQGKANVSDEELRIDVTVDKENSKWKSKPFPMKAKPPLLIGHATVLRATT